jgi:hypothetical protein
MKHTKARYILSIAATFGMLVTSCSFENLQMSGGTTTETTNGYVVGSLKKIDGSPASQTVVTLIKSNYDPVKDGPVPDSLVDTTGEAGEFAFHIAGGGTFNIQGRSSGEEILISGIMVKNSDTTTIPPGTIRQTGSIKILLPPDIDTARGYIYIRGTTFFAMLDGTSGFALLESVPAGTIPSVNYAVTSSSAGPKTIADSVSVAPGVTTVIGYQMGTHSAKLVLNTTASGAGIAGTVTNFPVLIRLGEGNFDFAQAKADGGDIRFAISNGAPLPYEIERWDPVNKLAEVWVKIDTVYGNDSAHFFIMYWGNPAATSASNGAAVFDTANGFKGVWHLSENGDSVYDATANAFHGVNSGSMMAAGIIGNSRKFADGNYLKISGLLNSPSSVTLSAWVQSDKSSGGQDIISIGDAVFIRLDNFGVKGASGWFHNSPITSDDSKYAIDSSGRNLANTGWHYLTYAINSETHVQTLYIDGVQTVTINDTNPIYYAGLGADTYIGIHGNGKTTYNFVGQIDEVRVSDIAESPDWIKLCFMNQKAQDALVKW